MKNIAGSATNVGNIDVAEGEKTRIHQAAYGVLMDMLSGIYSNASEAVLREYSANGWDEHQKHGVTRPVEVSLPSTFQPTLVIRDYGAGIPLDGKYEVVNGERVCVEMGAMEVFGEYGNSSKRDSDNEVGGFGIGSKAAFALGQQFKVRGFKDGKTFSVLFTLNSDGTGTKTVMHEGPTTEPNGVEVSLAVEDVDSMLATAKRFFSFWEKGDVLVDFGDGFVEPESIFDRLERISDDIYLDQTGRGRAFAVMGPVAYPVSRAILEKVARYLEKQDLGEVARLPLQLVDSSTDVYVKVPIGGVRPAPSREALRDKDITIRTIATVFYDLHQESSVKIQAEVDRAPTLFEAARAFNDGNAALGVFKVSRKKVLWHGKRIAKQAPVDLVNYSLVNKSWRSDTKVVGESPNAKVEFDQALTALVITGVDEETQARSVRRFAKRYLENNEEGIQRIFVTEADAISFEWFQVGIPGGVRSVNLEGWRALLKEIRKSSPRTVNEPSYTTGFSRASRDLEDRDLLSEIIGEGQDIVVFYESAQYLNKFDREVLKGYTPVVLLATQSEDMLRKRVEADGSVKVVDWSTLKPLSTALAQAVIDGVTQAEREALGARAWLQENRGVLVDTRKVVEALEHAGEVTSEALLAVEDAFALAEIFAAPVTEARLEEIRYANYQGLGKGHDLSDLTDPYVDDVENVFTDLPMLDASDVKQASRNILENTHLGENNELVLRHSYRWSTYDMDDLHRDTLLLHHALEYVNNH